MLAEYFELKESLPLNHINFFGKYSHLLVLHVAKILFSLLVIN